MTCDAMWIVGVAQSTILPFIHTLPVPLNAMRVSSTNGSLPNWRDLTSTLTGVSPQNGQRAPRAGSGLRQFQQKRLGAISRVRSGRGAAAGPRGSGGARVGAAAGAAGAARRTDLAPGARSRSLSRSSAR